MIHPDSELRFVSQEVGYGVFATRFIPKGTISYIKDPLEIDIPEEKVPSFDPDIQQIIEKYAYIDERGHFIISWDHGKYINHCCNCNTMSTGYGFEIAIRDIYPGEEITDEYGLFNMDQSMPLICSKGTCRGMIYPDDLERYGEQWDARVKDALSAFHAVPQPLLHWLDPSVGQKLEAYLSGEGPYTSVMQLRRGTRSRA